ncbi:MAG: folate-binding protein [Rhodospirillaceae bacterium]|jgi:folate-binding protein YgfZ
MSQTHYTRLEGRAILVVNGEDAVSFLQGLVSNDVEKVTATHSIWAAFLTPQGKFLHEFMMVHQPNGLYLDCEADRADDLMMRLKRFRLRSKVELEVAKSLSVAAVWGDTPGADFPLESEAGRTFNLDGLHIYYDPRLAEAGLRLIGTHDALTQVQQAQKWALASQSDYDAHRIALGLPDGSRDLEVEKALLLENGFEELGGVDFKKGCYIGQELTARTHYRALIKKRLLPVTFQGEAPPLGSPLTVDGKDAGEMKSSADGRGLALIRLATWRASSESDLTSIVGTVRVEPSSWMVLPEQSES